jgi:cell wall-associated NlpC family hydrolase
VGLPVDRAALEKGDLLFFSQKRDKVSHVAIYVGKGQFVHAPGKGKRIRTDLLDREYYQKSFQGARSYL